METRCNTRTKDGSLCQNPINQQTKKCAAGHMQPPPPPSLPASLELPDMKRSEPTFDTVNLYSYWASALINNDWSGLTDVEADELRAALIELGISLGSFVDVSNDSFFGTPDCSGLKGDIVTYTYRVGA